MTLSQMENCVVVGESTDTAEVIELARTHHPDVAVIDAGLTFSDPLEIARQVHRIVPKAALIMLTPNEDEERLFQAIKAGAAAYYRRDITPETLVDAVRKVSRGEYLINDDILSKPKLADRVFKSLQTLPIETEQLPRMACPLSTREIEILEYIARGNSNKEIAKLLSISDQTVKNHITSILKKLDVNDRTAAVVYALKQRWIKIDQSDDGSPATRS